MYNQKELRYPVVRNQPVARFYYQGNHSHPIRRTVLVTETTSALIKGYELREGATVRELSKAPIKSYSKSKIAVVKQCGNRLRKRIPQEQQNDSTFSRTNLLDALTNGI